MATGQMAFAERVVTTPGSPHLGAKIKVDTLTTVQALLSFASGAQVTFLTSWDVWNHGMAPIELHGTGGSMILPDPNWFGGDLKIWEGRADPSEIATSAQYFGRSNYPAGAVRHANYRGLGLADMARAIIDDRPHRASDEAALHVLAVMESILDAARDGTHVVIAQGCERPKAMTQHEAEGLLSAEVLEKMPG